MQLLPSYLLYAALLNANPLTQTYMSVFHETLAYMFAAKYKERHMVTQLISQWDTNGIWTTYSSTSEVCFFITSLTIVDAASKMPFEFPYGKKPPHINIVSYLLALMKKQYYPYVCACMDKGGELAKLEEFI